MNERNFLPEIYFLYFKSSKIQILGQYKKSMGPRGFEPVGFRGS